jgi:hypothetical protein
MLHELILDRDADRFWHLGRACLRHSEQQNWTIALVTLDDPKSWRSH